MTSPSRQPDTKAPLRFRIRLRETRVPPVFILGVVLMIIAIAFVSVREVPTGGSPMAAVQASAGPSLSPRPSETSPPSQGPSTGPSRVAALDPTPDPTATLSPTPLAPGMLTGYRWPLNHANVSLPFGPTTWGEVFVNGQRFHDGLDMTTYCGDSVYAAHDGTVLAASRHYDLFVGWAGDVTPYLNLLTRKNWWNSVPIVIVIDDGNGYRSIYAHEMSVTVKPGQQVKAGQVIGYEGATGLATGCHVHYGLFSMLETATFQSDPGVVKRDLIPTAEIARIDPLLVLPFRCEVDEMRALRPSEATLCPPRTPGPPAKPTAKPSATKAATAAPTAAPTEAPTAAS